MRRLAPVAALSLLLVGCAPGTRWPAVTDTPVAGQHLPGRWLWAELVTDDVERARRFYGALFGWEYEGFGEAPQRYTLIRSDGAPVGGIVARPPSPDGAPDSRWIGMLSVADVDQAAAVAQAADGQVKVAPRRLSGRGAVALLADPEGAVFGVIRADTDDPPDRLPQAGHWFWHELWAGDGEAMAGFYADLGGYTIEPVDDVEGVDEWHLRAGGYPRAGVIQVAGGRRAPSWLLYVRVADLAAAVARAQAADGTILLAPTTDVRDGRIAIITDPMGARVGLVEWHESDMAEVAQ